MIKMEKNFVAQEKGYPRKPYDFYDNGFLFIRLQEEVEELRRALATHDLKEAKKECADISNVIDYLFERLSKEG